MYILGFLPCQLYCRLLLKHSDGVMAYRYVVKRLMKRLRMIYVYWGAGSECRRAQQLFDGMEEQGLTRDTITYSSTISALAKSSHWSSPIQVSFSPPTYHPLRRLHDVCAHRWLS